MAHTRIWQTVELIIATLILAIGLMLAAVFAFNESFIGVFVGFLLFVLGYKLSQFAVRKSAPSPLRDTVRDIVVAVDGIETLMAIAAAGGGTYGFILLFDSIQQTQVELAVAAVLTILISYAIGHLAINRTLV